MVAKILILYFFVKASHKFNIKRLESVSAWRDEVKADMNTRVMDVNRSVNP